MTNDCKPEITGDDYLRVVALATMANDHYIKASEFSAAAQRIVMREPEQYPGNKLDDAIYSVDRVTPDDIAKALEHCGVMVACEAGAP